MGLFLGIIEKYNKNKGYITLRLKEPLCIGDTISLENEPGSYTVSELMDIQHQNITKTEIGQTVVIGRMKGNINLGNKIYKISSKNLLNSARESYQKEHKKIPLNCKVTIKKNMPISILITSDTNRYPLYKNMKIEQELNFIPLEAQNKPLDKETIISQISKTFSTPFEFRNISINLDENLFLPKLSILNELRRNALDEVEKYAIKNIQRNTRNINIPKSSLKNSSNTVKNKKVSILLNILNLSFDYSKLDGFDNIYIPLRYFANKKYNNIISILSKKFNTYIYMPTIIKLNYKNLFISNVEKAIKTYNIKGFVISNIGNMQLLNDIFNALKLDSKFEIISNYTLNTFNSQTANELGSLGITKFTISPELDKEDIITLCANTNVKKELIVYGKLPVLNMNYCLLGETNICYPNCKLKCSNNCTYYLKDRLNMKFRILPDNIQTVSTVFNCKIININHNSYPVDTIRIDILDESIDDILIAIKNANVH